MTGVNMTLREIDNMEERAKATKDAALMARANDGLLRLCAVVDETDKALDALILRREHGGARGEGA